MEKKKKMMGSNFFRIIHNYIIQDRRLELPKKFVAIFGKELGKAGVIEDPTGKIWPVELRKAEGEIYFQNGWQEFMDYFSIGVAHFLIFRYEGDSHFHVFICDMTACEIDYPCHGEDVDESYSERVSARQKDQVMDLPFQCATDRVGPSYAPSKRNRYEYYQRAVGSVKRNKSDGFGENTCKPWAFNFKRQPELVIINSESESDDKDYQNNGDSDKHNESSEEIETIGYRPSGKCHSDEVTSSSESVGERDDKDYQNAGDSDKHNVKDKIEENRCKPRAINFEGEPDLATINSDSESDEESPMRTKRRSAVHKGKCKIPKKASCATRKVGASECKFQRAASVIKEARAFESEFPTCTIIMTPSYVRKGILVNVPLEFARHYLTKTGDNFVTLKDSTGKKWHVGYKFYATNNFCLYKGWYEFVLDNCLKVDDVCVFELVNIENLEMKVNIIRASPDRRTMPTQPKSANHIVKQNILKTSEVKVHCPGQDASCAARTVDVSECEFQSEMCVIKEARAFKSDFPTCTMIIKASHLQKFRPVYMPCQFARDYLKKEGDNLLTLKDSTGRQWYVGYYIRRADTSSSSTNKASLYKGWYEFVLNNQLKVGDGCVFELVDTENLEMKVNIIRASPDRRTMPTQPKSANHKVKQNILKTSEVKVHCPGQDASCAAHRVDVSEREFQRALRVIKEARAFKSDFPTCTIIIKASHLQKFRPVYVPCQFARDYLKKEGDNRLTLKDSTGRQWYVGYYIRMADSSSYSTNKASLYKGWYEFVSNNQLKVGDGCVFELVDIENLEMKVNIIRLSPDVV